MVSCLFVALGGKNSATWFPWHLVVKAGFARVRTHYVYSAIAFFAVTLSFLRWMVGGDGGSAAKHRGEKVWDFLKFYHGGVKILPRCRKNSTAVV